MFLCCLVVFATAIGPPLKAPHRKYQQGPRMGIHDLRPFVVSGLLLTHVLDAKIPKV